MINFIKVLKMLLLLCLLVSMASCAGRQTRNNSYSSDGCEVVKVIEGEASYYGKKFHGRKTASGAVFDMYADTGAHKTLPLNTYVRVTNLSNNRQLVVLINDRGPYVGNRILDLSKGAAQKLGYAQQGVTRVRIEVLKSGDCTPSGYSKSDIQESHVASNSYGNIEVGYFDKRWKAERVYYYLKGRYSTIRVIPENDGFSVIIGPFTSEKVKKAIFSKLKSEGYDVKVK